MLEEEALGLSKQPNHLQSTELTSLLLDPKTPAVNDEYKSS